MSETKRNETSRRRFLKKTGAIAAATTLSALAAPPVHAAEDNTIKIALVGCGGRGGGAAVNALSVTGGPIKLVALADIFQAKVDSLQTRLAKRFGDKVDVPEERKFVGFDAYKKAIEAIGPGGVILLATPPCFRPMHVEEAVRKGVNIFMEKSFAVDAPGVHRILRAGEEASKKNLKVASGLMSRHYAPLEAAIEQIHDGAIGDIITCWAYRMHGPVGFAPRPADVTEMGHQIRNYHCYTWVNGSFILDWLIHNLDVCCWTKGAWPVSAQGQGARVARVPKDQLFDEYSVEYTFPDGTRMQAQGRHITGCFDFFGDVIHGTKGAAVIGEGVSDPKIYKSHNTTRENEIWRHTGDRTTPYQVEHQLLFDAIRSDTPYNETERSAYACMTGILGRMAAESGKRITWEEAFASTRVLAPGIEEFTMDTTPPVTPDAEGNYPVAVPGRTEVL